MKVGSATATTDSAGHFAMDKINTGNQSVEVAAEGYGPYATSYEVKRGANTLNVTLEDGTLRGVLRENAAVLEPIKGAGVTIAGQKATFEGRRFEITGVPVGSQTVKVTAPGHEAFKKTINVVPGENTLDIELNLTPVETYWRYYEAYRFGRHSEAYRFVHPDVKKHFSRKAYIHYEQSSANLVTWLSLKLFGSRLLDKWKASYLHKTYKHIVLIDRALRYQDAWGTYTENRSQHWQQIDGRWYIIFDWH